MSPQLRNLDISFTINILLSSSSMQVLNRQRGGPQRMPTTLNTWSGPQRQGILILFQDRWVANIVSKFENHAKQENDDNEEEAAAEAKIETNYAGFSDPHVEMEYIAVDQVLFDSKLFKT